MARVFQTFRWVILTLSITTFSLVLTGPLAAQNATESTPQVHVVAWGETLTAISARYGIPVDALIAANDLPADGSVFAGQVLRIPASAGGPSGGIGHDVTAGETAFQIAQAYNISLTALEAANPAVDINNITAGEILIIPTSVPPESPTPANTYTVRAGDTLFSIAESLGVSVDGLVALNNLLNPASIFVGQTLSVPGAASSANNGYTPSEASTTHTVQSGETLYAIASRYGVSVYVIAQVNNLSTSEVLFAGERLIIPAEDALSPPQPEAAPTTAANPPTPFPTAFVNPTAAPAASGSPKAIVVDVSEQRAYLYENGALINTYVVSTGGPGADTWRGEFAVQNKIPMAYASTWNLQMPYWLGFYWAGPLQNGFHALPILPDGSVLWEGYLGTPVSYGCVILSEVDAASLYNWAEVGTSVTVRD